MPDRLIDYLSSFSFRTNGFGSLTRDTRSTDVDNLLLFLIMSVEQVSLAVFVGLNYNSPNELLKTGANRNLKEHIHVISFRVVKKINRSRFIEFQSQSFYFTVDRFQYIYDETKSCLIFFTALTQIYTIPKAEGGYLKFSFDCR